MNEWTASPASPCYRIYSRITRSSPIYSILHKCCNTFRGVRDPARGWRDYGLFDDRYYVRKFETILLPIVSLSLYTVSSIFFLLFNRKNAWTLLLLSTTEEPLILLTDTFNEPLTILREAKISIRNTFTSSAILKVEHTWSSEVIQSR